MFIYDYRNRLVCLEFWATWCGPCRAPMQKLNQLATSNRDAWKDRVAVVAVSIDENAETVKQEVVSRGLSSLEPYWSGSDGSRGWESPAAKTYAVSGVPAAVLIDREGRILWRGHPAADPDGKDLAARVEAALKP